MMAPSTALAVQSTDVLPAFDTKQTLTATKALLSHIKKEADKEATSSTKKDLLTDADDAQALSGEIPIWLTITTKRHMRESRSLKPQKIQLPHPLNTDPESTICIIVPEPQRAYKNMVASEGFPDALRQRITRVIDLKHLKAKFKQYEAQRKLFSEHDVFLGDDRIINRLPAALGKSFYKSTVKRPVPVEFAAPREKQDGKRVKRVRTEEEKLNIRPLKEIIKEIEKAVGAALVHLSPSTNTSIRVGTAGMKPAELAANIETVSKQVVAKYVVKNGKNDVRSIFIKGPETVALPIWETAELWVDGGQDVVADGSEQAKMIEEKAEKREKANVGKKRKAITATGGVDEEDEEMANDAEKPIVKKAKKIKALPESNDDKLDKEIDELKASLKKRKSAAKKAMAA